MTKKLFILLIVYSSSFIVATAQLKSGEFAIGGKFDEYASGVAQTEDRGYVICGTIYALNSIGGDANEEMCLVKLDSLGNFQWGRKLNPLFMCHGLTLITNKSTDKQEIVLVGDYTDSGIPVGAVDCFDMLGNKTWALQINKGGVSASAISKDRNGNIIITGGWGTNATTGDTGPDIDDTLLSDGIVLFDIYCISSTGIMVWSEAITDPTKTYTYFYSNAITQTKDGGYIITGGIGNDSQFNSSGLLVKVDPSGKFQWAKKYQGTDSIGTDIVETKDGGVVVCGVTSSVVSGNNIFVEKFDSSYNVQWEKIIGTIHYAEVFSIIQTLDGGYAITGSIVTSGNSKVYMAKLDALGSFEWAKAIGGTQNDGGHAIVQCLYPWDKGYALAGYTYSYGYRADTTDNMYFIKLDSLGNSCNSKTISGNATNGYNTITNINLLIDSEFTSGSSYSIANMDSMVTVCSNYTGLDNISLPDIKTSIYPNPFTTETAIDFGVDGKYYIEVDDIMGRKIEWLESDQRQYELMRNNLTAGVYLLKVYDSDRHFIATLKLVAL